MQSEDQAVIPALVIDNVSKEFHQWQRVYGFRNILKNLLSPQKKVIKALDKISFQVAQGEFLAYVGANGAGKSTTLKILSGILRPTSGQVSVQGLSPHVDRVKLMKQVGVLFGQRTELWWDHPVINSYEWKRKIWDIPDDVYQRNFKMVCELLELGPLLHTFSRKLSLGQRLRADIGMLLLHEPKIIFLDEPTLGLDIRIKKKVIDILKEINKEKKTTIVVTSHDIADLELMARRILLLAKGKLVFDGSFEELRSLKHSFTYFKIFKEGEPPILPEFVLQESDGYCHSYMASKKQLNIQDFIGKVQNIKGVENIEIGKVPIEAVIEQIYQDNATKM